MTRTAKIRRRTNTAARTTTKALYYRCINGTIGSLVDTGRLIKTGDFLDRIGGHDLPDGQKSWFGRHVAKAYRATHGCDAPKVWTQHRTTGKWIHVFVYGPIDDALYTALRTYKGTRHLLASTYTEAA